MSIAENIEVVKKRIAQACEKSNRDFSEVTLVAVSKGQPPESIIEASCSGIKIFGENRVQEAKSKIPFCPSNLRWHMIGHLQTNKARDCVRLFEMIQSVDSLHLALEIQKCAEKESKQIPILLEVNVAGEASKFGIKPEVLIQTMTEINKLTRLEIQGLMTIAPWTPEPEKVRPVFRKLKELKLSCEDALGAPLPHLSMGMSNDFDIAIEEGATIVRIGTAIFGQRT